MMNISSAKRKSSTTYHRKNIEWHYFVITVSCPRRNSFFDGATIEDQRHHVLLLRCALKNAHKFTFLCIRS